MKVLVLGGGGMLGHKMFQVLGRRFETSCTLRHALDIPLFANNTIVGVDALRCRPLLEARRPDVVVNCVGIIKQREESRSPVSCIEVNALFPHLLADWVATWGGRLIHFSTDCVFSGSRGSYVEDDPPDALDLYGRTKTLGEVTARNALTLRTSFIGRELANDRSLVEWFLAERGRKIEGYSRAIYAGLTTEHLAEIVTDILTGHPTLHGLLHVSSKPITKFELLCGLRDAFGIDVEIEPNDEVAYDRSLVGTRFTDATGIQVRSWPDMLQRLATDPTPYANWRR